MTFTENLAIAILSLIGMMIIGYSYYRRSIKVARELIKIQVGNQQYEKLRKY